MGTPNHRNSHSWALGNPNGTNNSFYHRFSVNIWFGIKENRLIGPFVLEHCLTGGRYLNFL
jgi:hypothetical protein